jgi:guanylate kinase
LADISATPAGTPAPQDLHDQEPRSARLTVLAGPTAVGKGTVSADVRARYPQVWLSVSATTRPPRPGEVDGVHYLFVTPEQFDTMVADGEMLEWAVVHGRHRYGTPRRPVVEALAAGVPTLLEIDLQGARQVRETMPEARFVFLAPPSFDELVRRLVGRGTEDAEERERRLATARVELAAEREFDVTIVNDDVHRATDELVRAMGIEPTPVDPVVPQAPGGAPAVR